ncbi:MAG: hypothetical protein GY854_12850 [Deltaproteobacteria bacterium]|nr:hypothetical protein [Deltaproteobacteria bacterium]
MKNLQRLHVNPAAVLALLAWLSSPSCKQQEEKDLCVDEPPPSVQLPQGLGEVELQAALSIDEWVEKNEDDSLETGGMLRAHFVDMTSCAEESTPAIPFGEACFGIAGQPNDICDLERLEADAVVFKGLVDGDVALEKNDAGLFLPEGLPDAILSDEGGETLKVEVSSTSGETAFPAFDIEITAPPRVVMNRIEMTPNWSMEVEWEPADATFFEVVLKTTLPGEEQHSNRLRCLLADDGCHEIPAEGVEWLRSQGADEVNVLLKRHMLAHKAATSGALAELDATRSMEFDLVLE